MTKHASNHFTASQFNYECFVTHATSDVRK